MARFDPGRVSLLARRMSAMYGYDYKFAMNCVREVAAAVRSILADGGVVHLPEVGSLFVTLDSRPNHLHPVTGKAVDLFPRMQVRPSYKFRRGSMHQLVTKIHG